jgi:hypothetical protein
MINHQGLRNSFRCFKMGNDAAANANAMERKFHAEGMLRIRPDAGAGPRRRAGFVTARSRQGFRCKLFRLQGPRTAPAEYSDLKRFPKTANDS